MATPLKYSAMNDQVSVSVVIDAPIHSPFKQSETLVGSQGLKGYVAIEFKDALWANPASKPLCPFYRYMKICESFRGGD